MLTPFSPFLNLGLIFAIPFYTSFLEFYPPYFYFRPSNTTVATEATMVASKPNVVATAAIRNHKVNGGGHLQRPTDIDHNPDVIPCGNTGLMHHVSIHGPGKRFHVF